jgi:hypothetical protein
MKWTIIGAIIGLVWGLGNILLPSLISGFYMSSFATNPIVWIFMIPIVISSTLKLGYFVIFAAPIFGGLIGAVIGFILDYMGL